jgi:hypothetical protein
MHNLCRDRTDYSKSLNRHHHQPINIPTAGAQALLMDHPQGERAMIHHACLVWIGGN